MKKIWVTLARNSGLAIDRPRARLYELLENKLYSIYLVIVLRARLLASPFSHTGHSGQRIGTAGSWGRGRDRGRGF